MFSSRSRMSLQPNYLESLNDGLAKKHNLLFSVIPAKAGIQEFQKHTNRLDTRFRGYDDFLRVHHKWLVN